MTRPCTQLKKLTRREMSQSETEKGWEKDLVLYDHCRNKHIAYVQWIKDRDAKLMGK